MSSKRMKKVAVLPSDSPWVMNKIKAIPYVLTVALSASALIWMLAIAPAQSAVKVNPLFSDHMVLQRGVKAPVWGTATPGEKIEVDFAGQKANSFADAAGKWKISLEPLAASKIPGEIIIRGMAPQAPPAATTDADSDQTKSTAVKSPLKKKSASKASQKWTEEIHIKDVLVGDVWIGSGQSNMEFAVRDSTDAGRASSMSVAGRYKNIRLFLVPHNASDTPVETVKSSWKLASGKDLDNFSGVLFYFGEELQLGLPDVPIGLIDSSYGGTWAFCWVPNQTFDSDKSYQPTRKWYQDVTKNYDQQKSEFDAKLDAYRKEAADLKSRNLQIPPDLHMPNEPIGPKHPKRPSALYNGMIAPLQPFAFTGVLWYQGEADALPEFVPQYLGSLKALIYAWRYQWERSSDVRNFPFYLVQLANYDAGRNDWPAIRETQAKCAKTVPNCGFVVTIDVGSSGDIHPKDKTTVGKRLAKLALAKTYEKQVPCYGPQYRSYDVDRDKVRVSFESDPNSLKCVGSKLKNFSIAGVDEKFVPAEASIDGADVIVESPKVPKPVAVRYAWENDPHDVNFYNSAGLPASPFRTDTFPLELPPNQ